MADGTEDKYVGFRPLSSYRNLPYGPNFNPSNQGSESAALDGTKKSLRDPVKGSPFTFRIVPPAPLIAALNGGGQPQTRSPFDPLLGELFERRLQELDAVEDRFLQGLATQQELDNARQALLGSRPDSAANVNIVETAQRASNNFLGVTKSRKSYNARSFFANSDVQGSGTTQQQDLIARDGQRFNPDRASQSSANQPAVADLAQAQSVLTQLNQMLATPALTLLVNPEQLQITYGQKQSYSDRSRYNYIFQRWGEEQVRLSVSGRSAGFVVGTLGGAGVFEKTTSGGLVPVENDEVSGYQYASKWDSAAWQNLMGLFSFYRNNGYIYDLNGRPKSEAHLFVGSIEISYDQWSYVGNFENFNYSYNETKQHGAVEFSFEFVASFIHDRSKSSTVSKIQGVTPSPADDASTATSQDEARLAGGANANAAQTRPDGADGTPSTDVLDDQIGLSPSQNPFVGPEIAPGVRLPPGSTVYSPTGGNNGGFGL